jgi:endogenous inhibitor of DNA gyrase (YacG/DUF329 family)
MPIIQCICGCGTGFEERDDHGRKRRFVSGHNCRVSPTRVGERITYKCEYCGKDKTKLLSQHKPYKHHFCSEHCKSVWFGKTYGRKGGLAAQKSPNKSKPPLIPKEEHWNWKGGISKQNRGQDFEYKKWVREVLRRDDFTCSVCGNRGGRLSAHHIHEWEKYPELRYYPENGLCMCYADHMKWHGLNKGASR